MTKRGSKVRAGQSSPFVRHTAWHSYDSIGFYRIHLPTISRWSILT